MKFPGDLAYFGTDLCVFCGKYIKHNFGSQITKYSNSKFEYQVKAKGLAYGVSAGFIATYKVQNRPTRLCSRAPCHEMLVNYAWLHFNAGCITSGILCLPSEFIRKKEASLTVLRKAGGV